MLKSSVKKTRRWMISDRSLVEGDLSKLCQCINRAHPPKDRVILREKSLSREAMLMLIEQISTPIILNWEGDFALLTPKLGGIHLSYTNALTMLSNQEFCQWLKAKKEIEPSFLLGASIHSFEQWQRIQNTKWDYLLLSNLYETPCKMGKKGLGLLEGAQLVQKIKAQTPQIEIIALGGVFPKNLDTLQACGFDGIAMRRYYHSDIF